MGTKYATQSAVGYNATAPVDDGTSVEGNRVTWAKHKTKLGDPIKQLSDDINSALLLDLDESVNDTGISYTTVASDHKRTVNSTAATTISLGDASTMGVGYVVTIKNTHSADITVDVATGTDTLDGVVDTDTLNPNDAVTYVVNSSANGYIRRTSTVAAILDTIYPIGSIYMSVLSTDPGTLFGGTWEALAEGRTLIGAGSGAGLTARTAGTELGAEDAVLVSHSHTGTADADGSHTHNQQDYNSGSGGVGANLNTGSPGGWHTGSISTVGDHTHSLSISTDGVSATDANMMPSLVTYMWERAS